MEASRLIEEQVSRCQLESDRPCVGHLGLMSGLLYVQSDQATLKSVSVFQKRAS